MSRRPGGRHTPPARRRRPGTGRTGPTRPPTTPARKRTLDSGPPGRAWWPLPCPCPSPRVAGHAAWRRKRTRAAAPAGCRPGPAPGGPDRAPCARLPPRGPPAPAPACAGGIPGERAPAPSVFDFRDCACRARLTSVVQLRDAKLLDSGEPRAARTVEVEPRLTICYFSRNISFNSGARSSRSSPRAAGMERRDFLDDAI